MGKRRTLEIISKLYHISCNLKTFEEKGKRATDALKIHREITGMSPNLSFQS